MRRFAMLTAVVLWITAAALVTRAADAGKDAPKNDLKAQVVKAYQDTTTYQAKVQFSITQKQGRRTIVQSSDYTVAFDRPAGKVAVDRPEFQIVGDGQKVRMKTDQIPGKYIEAAAPKTLDFASLNSALDAQQGLLEADQVPDVAMLLSADPLQAISGDATTKVEEAKLGDGQTGLQLKDGQGSTWTLQLDPTSRLVTKATVAVDAAKLGGKPGDSVTVSFDIKVQKHNQPLDVAAFAFDAGKRAKAFGSLKEMVQAGGGPGDEPTHPLEGQVPPPVKLTGMDGKPFDLADVKADVIVLDFWATWCPPCRKSLPKLQAVYDWAQAEKKSVAIYAVNVREKQEEASDYWTKNKLTMSVLMDSDGVVSKAYSANAIPQTVIIYKGKVEIVHVGLPEEGDFTEILKGQIGDLIGGGATTQPAR